MVALLLYACAQGIRSSRAIEHMCREDVAFMVITAMRAPGHSTIAEFRKRHERALAGLFGEVLGICEKPGLVKVGVIAIDGTKISANASMDADAPGPAPPMPPDVLGPVLRVLILAAAITGLRQSELLGLRWRDVDWTAQRIRVRNTFVRGEHSAEANWIFPRSGRYRWPPD